MQKYHRIVNHSSKTLSGTCIAFRQLCTMLGALSIPLPLGVADEGSLNPLPLWQLLYKV